MLGPQLGRLREGLGTGEVQCLLLPERTGQNKVHGLHEISWDLSVCRLPTPSRDQPYLHASQGSRWLCRPHCPWLFLSLAMPVCDIGLSDWHLAQLRGA